ncbi:MAG: hypothetical protein JW881_16540 [Spirochaetales bacterium]|nr:hypothetical protein [Spirochaetales bacterium]
MSIHVCILGIDGSGKSTISASLPALLSAALGVPVASAGEKFRMTTPTEDHLGPGFQPERLPLEFHLSRFFKRKAKKNVENRRLYQVFKVAHMLFQDASAKKLEKRYEPAIVVSDGNAILSACGREVNYRKTPGSRTPEPAELARLFGYVLDGRIPDPRTIGRMPKAVAIKKLKRICDACGIKGFWLPDIVFFLDVRPSSAMKRIAARGRKIDGHENEKDLNQAREMYLKTLEAFSIYRPEALVEIIRTDGSTPGEVLRKIVGRMKAGIRAKTVALQGSSAPLGKSEDNIEDKSFWSKILNRKYIFNYLCAKCFDGAWREPFFVCSPHGRVFLKEGYSANVMKIIYENTDTEKNPFNRIFLGYPLNRAVYDRLEMLVGWLYWVLREKLVPGKEVTVFSAPCGFAYDMLGALNRLKKESPRLLQRVRFVASDLDPYGDIEPALAAKARELDITFDFIKGDIRKAAVRKLIRSFGPFDIELFIGLSGWLPKPAIVGHMRFLVTAIKPDGVCLTDTFTAAAYSFSGYYAGFRGNYYEPEIYRAMLDYAGFNGQYATVESGRDGINHLIVVRPRRKRSFAVSGYETATYGRIKNNERAVC